MANVNATIKETVSGIASRQEFPPGRHASSSEFDQANRQSYGVNVRRGLVLSLVFPVLNALGGIAMALLVYVGGIERGSGAGHRRGLVFIHPEPGPLLLPGAQPFRILGAGAAGAFGVPSACSP